MRRAVGFLVMLLTLHLFVASADLACAGHAAAHGAHGAYGSRAMDMSAMTQPGQAHGSNVRGEPGDDCRTPVSPDCCSAMTSCAVSMIASADRASAPLPLSSDRRIAFATEGASLRAAAPETPPPRA